MRLLRTAVIRSLPAVMLLAGTLGAASVAQAQMPPPPGWSGEHYYYHGRHYHHRAWAFDRNHRRYRRYW